MTFEQLLELVRSNSSPRLVTNSRLVQPGDCFIAIKGTTYDGHNFIHDAIKAGAQYLLTDRDITTDRAEIIRVDDTSLAAAILAQAKFDNPASKLTNLAVTGTNGKTTVAFLVRSIFNSAGIKCGLIGTVIYDTCRDIRPAELTTPDCITIAQMQRQMLDNGARYMITEASSHALTQNRLAQIPFHSAAFTNLSAEHLDYHRTLSDYLSAKSSLFESLSPDNFAILNYQSPHAHKIAQKTPAKILWYGIETDTDISATGISQTIDGTRFILNYKNESAEVISPLIGRYNISNHLAAAGLAVTCGIDIQNIALGLSALDNVPGRLEKITTEKGFYIIIDYAHTDDALKNVLATLKPLCKARLSVVFGCGGDRDRSKRPRMAAVAERYADRIFVTSDNPRSEPPNRIIDEIVSGFTEPRSKDIVIEPDRASAIKQAINSAQQNDIILIAGKGHENYQIINDRRIPFSDRQTVLESIT